VPEAQARPVPARPVVPRPRDARPGAGGLRLLRDPRTRRGRQLHPRRRRGAAGAPRRQRDAATPAGVDVAGAVEHEPVGGGRHRTGSGRSQTDRHPRLARVRRGRAHARAASVARLTCATAILADMNLLIRWGLSALALWITVQLGVGVSMGQDGLGPLLVSALVLGLVNAVVRPVMVLLT